MVDNILYACSPCLRRERSKVLQYAGDTRYMEIRPFQLQSFLLSVRLLRQTCVYRKFVVRFLELVCIYPYKLILELIITSL